MPGLNFFRLLTRSAAAGFMPGNPAYLIFFVTDRCQGKCPFCFNRERAAKAEGERELTVGEIEKIAERWPGLLQLTLTGGEPFIRPDIPAIVRAFVRRGLSSLTINTNGLLSGRITENVNAILSGHPGLFLDLDISFDGPAELHDRLRGVPGIHEKAMETARALSPLQQSRPGFRVGATVTVSAMNESSAAKTVEDLAESGLFRRVQAVRVRGKTFAPEAGQGPLEGYEAACEFLGRTRLGKGGGRLREIMSAMVREKVRAGAVGQRGCRAGRTMVEIDPYGDVLPCEMLPQKDPGVDWTLGNLRESDYSIAAVMKSERAAQIRNWIVEKKCRCTFECAAYNNLVFDPKSWPEILVRLLGG